MLTYGGGVECLAFSPDGRRLVSGHDDNALRVWELPSGRPLHVIKGHTGPSSASRSAPTAAPSPLAAETEQCGSGTPPPASPDSPSPDTPVIRGLVFTPDGQTVLSGGLDRTIQAWDPATGVVRYVLRATPIRFTTWRLSPDGRTLASASYDKTCILWDLPGRQPALTLRGHAGSVNAVAFSPDGRTLATASDDHTVRLWDAADRLASEASWKGTSTRSTASRSAPTAGSPRPVRTRPSGSGTRPAGRPC